MLHKRGASRQYDVGQSRSNPAKAGPLSQTRHRWIIVALGVATCLSAFAAIDNSWLPGLFDTPGNSAANNAPPPAQAIPKPSVAAANVLPPALPTFDVVRINPLGDAVLAGRAPAGSHVVVHDGDSVVGETTADGNGAWAVIPDHALSAGARQFTLSAKLAASGQELQSDQLVAVVVPEPNKNIAGQAKAGTGEALAMLASRVGDDTQVLQAPPVPQQHAAPVAPVAPAPAAVTAAEPAKAPEPAPSPTSTQTQNLSAASQHVLANLPGQSLPNGTIRPLAAPETEALLASLGIKEQPATANAAKSDNADEAPVETAPQSGSVGIVVLDYDKSGQIVLGGTAQANAPLQIYLDNTLLGRTHADSLGSWHLRPDRSVSPGRYRLRADQLNAAGQVTARAELPLQMALAANEAETKQPAIAVQPDNSAWRVARRQPDQSTHYTLIFGGQDKQKSDPASVLPGQIFVEPPGN